MSASVWAVTRESISPKTKEIRLDLRNRIVDAHKAGDRHTKLSERFQVSRTGVKSIVKKFKDEYRTSPAEIESKGFQRLQARLNYAKDKPVERLRILETLGMDRRFVFQHDNDPKRLLLLVPEDQSEGYWHDFNPTENLWAELKMKVPARRNLRDFPTRLSK